MSFTLHVLDLLPYRDFRDLGRFKNLGRWKTLDLIIFMSGSPEEVTAGPVKDGRGWSCRGSPDPIGALDEPPLAEARWNRK